jgi:hypothetical protein
MSSAFPERHRLQYDNQGIFSYVIALGKRVSAFRERPFSADRGDVAVTPKRESAACEA